MSKRVRKDGVVLGPAGLLLGISLGAALQALGKTPSFPPLMLRLTHYVTQDKDVLNPEGF